MMEATNTQGAQALPWTPDFDVYPIRHRIAEARIEGGAVRVCWDDGKENDFHFFFLRENSPDENTIHPLSRESLLPSAHLPADLVATEVAVEDGGALRITWSHGGLVSRYHPGWLRAYAYFEDAPEESLGWEPTPPPVLWTAATLKEVPHFDGVQAMAEPRVFVQWLEALRDYGVASLKGLPQEDGYLEKVIGKIGVLRESNFGRVFRLVIKDDPDSNAYTSDGLQQHMDLATRECPPGLQFLYCRENTTTGGEGVYSDAYAIAEDMRREEPQHFESLTTDTWAFNNRAKDNDYRASGPIIALDAAGNISSVRYTPWLTSPIVAPLAVQDRMYKAFRAFSVRNDDSRYQILVRYEAGDLFAFDNRRAMHGRKGYDAKGGSRFIEGAYSDRDELHSRIRTIHRHLRRAAAHLD